MGWWLDERGIGVRFSLRAKFISSPQLPERTQEEGTHFDIQLVTRALSLK